MQMNKGNKEREGSFLHPLDEQISYLAILEEAPVNIVVVNKHKCIYMNRSALRLLALEGKADIVGHNVLEIFHQDHHHCIRSILDTCTTEKIETIQNVKIISNNEKCIFIQVKAKGIEINNEKYTEMVFTEMNEFSQSYQMKEQETLSVVGELAAGIAHEIRNPLTSLKGFIQLVQEHPQQGELYKDIMLTEIERINLIVNELLLLAKPKITNHQVHNLHEILESTIILLNSQAILKDVKINFESKKIKKSLYVPCDDHKLKQVFINIIKNGIEAMPHGGVLDIQIKKRHKEASITFVDNGNGIPKQNLSKIGEAFFTTKSTGTGLGLMMSMNIIHNHNGHINIESEEGVGTKIEVILPLQ